MALDSTGFERKRFDDLFSEMESKAKEVFGQQLNTSERSPMGIILRLFAWFLARAWQNSEDVYNSGYPNTSEGVNLDRLGPYGGITRIQASRAMGVLQITGTAGYTVSAGFRASGNGQVFETIEAVTLNGSGTGTVAIRAITPGRLGNVTAGIITTIVNPTANVMAVTNLSATSGGREKETDSEFRARFSVSSEGRGKATLASIRAALLNVPGVRAATVVENYSSNTVNGRPPKSFEAYVLGGTSGAIGQAILNTKAAGIEPYGGQSVTVKDDAGFEHIMKYSPAVEVPIYLRFSITTDASYPANGDDLLRTSSIRYIGGEDVDGTLYVGLNMGEDVVYARLFSVAYSVVGISDVTVEVSTDGTTWVQANITINQNEVAQIDHTRVLVVHAL